MQFNVYGSEGAWATCASALVCLCVRFFMEHFKLMLDLISFLAPPEIQVACFQGADNLAEVLGDFTKEIQWDNTNEVVKKCAKLAYNKGFNLFALGQNGLCLSGADTRRKYHISGTYGAKCRDGIGMGKSMFVYTLGIYWKHPYFLLPFLGHRVNF